MSDSMWEQSHELQDLHEAVTSEQKDAGGGRALCSVLELWDAAASVLQVMYGFKRRKKMLSYFVV